ncbi:MAG: nucleotidyltransferase [Archangium gephyra]|uniref:Nucleotidyltransferase n=1 Tax=Archangium gephyra TaxID=48 RepID=A0A2W5VNP3_9BACT|nr:MAG: nucleotidyltransferase [Archangium gephyra]
MKAMVLCAGLGTRLRPLTNVWPKPAMPLLGGPLFRYSVATLRNAGITQIGINTHHLPDVMAATARAEVPNVEIVHEAGEIQGTGGGIRGLKHFLGGDDFVVLNGDVLFSVDLTPVIAAHRASGAAATMLLLPMPEGEKYNAVEVDPSGHVRRIAGRGPGGEKLSNWHFTGVHVMTPAVFDFMSASGPEDINRDVYVRMLEQGLTIGSHVLRDKNAYWSDLGTPQRYAATHQDLLFGQVKLEPFGAHGPLSGVSRGDGNFWVHPTANVDLDVKVAGPAYFGANCSVDGGVRLGAAVSIGANARVGRNVRLNRVAVLEGAVIPEGASLADQIVGPEASVSTL